MISALIGVFGTILGVGLGWMLNRFTESEKNKPKLCGALEFRNSEDLTPIELRTKTSETGYTIKIYNIGNTPFIVRNVAIYNDKDIIVDCLEIGSEYTYTVFPYQSVTCIIMQQDLSNLEWHLKKIKRKSLNLVIESVDGHTVTCKLDMSIIRMNIDLQEQLYCSMK